MAVDKIDNKDWLTKEDKEQLLFENNFLDYVLGKKVYIKYDKVKDFGIAEKRNGSRVCVRIDYDVFQVGPAAILDVEIRKGVYLGSLIRPVAYSKPGTRFHIKNQWRKYKRLTPQDRIDIVSLLMKSRIIRRVETGVYERR